jgi:RNA polymerase sigma-70 factor (ECF subfamily)
MAAELDFATVYREHVDYVWASLRRLGVFERDLEDVTHEVFLVVHRRLDDYDRARPLRPWLFGIAARVASEQRRKAARRREVIGDAEAPAATDASSPESSAMRRQAIALVRGALDRVDDDARAVFLLVDLDGTPVPEAATALGIPLNTAYTRLRRARLTLTEVITRDLQPAVAS